MVSNDGERVTGRDESALSVDHVTVTVTVRGSTEVDVVLLDSVNQAGGVDEVGVGVVTTKVGLGNAVLGGTLLAELLLKDIDAVVSSDTAEAVEENLEVGVLLEESLDEVKVEDVLEHLDVVLGRVDDLNLEVAVGLGADRGKVDIGNVGNLVLGEGLGGLVDLVGDALGSGGTVSKVVLDTKVLLGT